MNSVEGKVILVTGAARGIGAAIAARLSETAEALVLTDIADFDPSLPCAAHVIRGDLGDPTVPPRLVEETLARFGRIDGLVNAAGLTTRGSFFSSDATLFDRLFAVNTRAPFQLMGGAIADMRARAAPGSIVNIQSMNAHGGAPDLAIYSATKGALQTLTTNAAHAHLSDRIRVNGINLGWVDTKTERQLQEETLGKGAGWMAKNAPKMPIGRFVSEDDAARLALYLLSDDSAPMTGVSLDLEQIVMGGL
ncbi:MAG: oxidoreductase [Pseudomonadota bacterium]